MSCDCKCENKEAAFVVGSFSSTIIAKSGEHYDVGFVDDKLKAGKHDVSWELEQLLLKAFEAGRRSREDEFKKVLGL